MESTLLELELASGTLQKWCLGMCLENRNAPTTEYIECKTYPVKPAWRDVSWHVYIKDMFNSSRRYARRQNRQHKVMSSCKTFEYVVSISLETILRHVWISCLLVRHDLQEDVSQFDSIFDCLFRHGIAYFSL